MSESFTASRIEQPGKPVLKPACTDLNGIVAGVIAASKDRLSELGAIVRQDELAPARGDAEDFKILFSNLLEIILNHPPKSCKLFIYIRSVQNDPAADDKMVTVSIYTNTDYHPGSEKMYAALLSQCGNLCEKYGGGFIYHLVSNTSCLFTINLQGK
jgi:hypothetical protein